jgi:hypothetical protein
LGGTGDISSVWKESDTVIDAHVSSGNILVHFEDLRLPVSLGSTYPMVSLVNALIIRVVEYGAKIKGRQERSRALLGDMLLWD